MIKDKKIYVVKDVRLRKCTKDAFANYQEIGAEISFLQKDVSFVVVWDVIPKKSLQGLHQALRGRNPSKAKAPTVYTIKWKII